VHGYIYIFLKKWDKLTLFLILGDEITTLLILGLGRRYNWLIYLYTCDIGRRFTKT